MYKLEMFQKLSFKNFSLYSSKMMNEGNDNRISNIKNRRLLQMDVKTEYEKKNCKRLFADSDVF